MGTLSLHQDNPQVYHIITLPIIDFLNIIFYYKHNLKGEKGSREKNPKHFQEGILKLLLEVSWSTPIHLHQLIYVF